MLVQQGAGAGSSYIEDASMSAERAAQPAPGLRVGQIGQMFLRRVWLVVGVVIVLNGLALIAIAKITPRYTAEASLIIGPRQAQVMDVKSVMAGLTGDADVLVACGPKRCATGSCTSRPGSLTAPDGDGCAYPRHGPGQQTSSLCREHRRDPTTTLTRPSHPRTKEPENRTPQRQPARRRTQVTPSPQPQESRPHRPRRGALVKDRG